MTEAAHVIQISDLQALVGFGIFLVGMSIAWGSLRGGFQNLETTIRNTLTPDLKDVRERFIIVEDRVEMLWREKFSPAHTGTES